jgi:L-ascorbate metabolism protein UlaG (beta-lactamase superfamily)
MAGPFSIGRYVGCKFLSFFSSYGIAIWRARGKIGSVERGGAASADLRLSVVCGFWGFMRILGTEKNMWSVRLLTVSLLLGAAVCGCKEEKPGAEKPRTEEKETEGTKQRQVRKEAAMGVALQWLGHASFKICHENTVVYIDPWKLKDSPHDAELVLVSHSHYDHYSPDDIAKVSGPDTKLVASADVVAKEKAGEAIMPGVKIELGDIRVTGVAAYNPAKDFHPRANNWVGFVIEAGSKRIYYAGDSDLTEEMKALRDIDVALLPVGGTYTMNATDAAEAAKHIEPKRAIPYHWGDIVGSGSDADKFAELAGCEVTVLSVGQTVNLE